VLAWSKNLRESIHSNNLAAGKGLAFMYMNDAADDQKALSGLPPANLAKLKTIRSKYDPNFVFRNLMPGGFKLD